MEEMQKVTKSRIRSIDVMRGLTLFLMLFVNDLFSPAASKWLLHTEGHVDGIGLADWVFPGFLFMVGIAVPYAILARRKKGDSSGRIFCHVLFRTLSLLLIGVLILNGGRVNAALTQMPQLLWSACLYVCIFLVWNLYPKTSRYNGLFIALRAIGVLGLLYLVFIFKAGTAENIRGLEIGWWGILGLIGWGYFAAAVVYLLARDRIIFVVCCWLLFVALNILSQQGLLPHIPYVGRYFGVLLSGNVPSIVLAGLLVGLLIRRYASQPFLLLRYLVILAIFWIVAGFSLRNWFILSKIYGTPSWAMLCNGLSLLLLIVIYYLVDIKKFQKGIGIFETVGRNSLTTYLAPDVIYFICWGFSIPLFFYKQPDYSFLAVGGSLLWAYSMLWFAVGLQKLYIQLKL
ncbi:DUF5009 domain-containing protein [Sphingobacterium sp. Mn56C]|uniref:DUF5009 domain-containing protein n=1 Tax=Sphingobacterium sp. Mn56C TaxID=3395261 RepID=UPI003BBC8119